MTTGAEVKWEKDNKSEARKQGSLKVKIQNSKPKLKT
jgi:hypothetical protein